MIVFQPYTPPKTLTSENTILSWKGQDFTCPHIKQACATWGSASPSSLQATSCTWASQSQLLTGRYRRVTSGPLHNTGSRLNSSSPFPPLGLTRLSWQQRFLILSVSWISPKAPVLVWPLFVQRFPPASSLTFLCLVVSSPSEFYLNDYQSGL